MVKVVRRSRFGPPAWRVVAAGLAVLFLASGSSMLLAPPAGMPGDLGPLTACLGAAELVGGLMLLVPGLVSHAAFFLAAVVGVVVLVGSLTVGRGAALPAAAVLAALLSLGHARRPGPLLRARLERALERFHRLEMSRTEGVHREGF